MENEIQKVAPSISSLIHAAITVVDCGCYGWRLLEQCQAVGANLIGVDESEPPGRPPWASFATIKNEKISVPDGIGDLVVASHVLEHIQSPASFFLELTRITRPEGMIWVESPSELSALKNGSDDPQDHSFESFWDDPTHIRPWTPGALYRLAIGCGVVPKAIGRVESDGIPSVRMLAQKPKFWLGRDKPRYVGLRCVAPALKSAWEHVWGESD